MPDDQNNKQDRKDGGENNTDSAPSADKKASKEGKMPRPDGFIRRGAETRIEKHPDKTDFS